MRTLWGRLNDSASAFTLGDLIQLAAAGEAPGRAGLDKIFEWYFQRATSTIRFGLGLAGGSIATLVAAVLKHQTDLLVYALLLFAALGGAVIGAVQLRLLAHLHSEYAVSLRLLVALCASEDIE